MKVGFSASAWRQWKKFPLDIQNQLQRKLLFYSKSPLKYSSKLTDQKIGQFRFRIGNYRIVFDIRDNNMIIIAVGHRKNIYK